MRQRQDFYTLCPSCEARVSLPLVARLQAGRHGTTCRCSSCSNEWTCIQEWIYRDTPSQFVQQPPVVAQGLVPGYGQQPAPGYAAPAVQHPAHTQTPSPMPRPHLLPTYQPPQRVQSTQHVQSHVPTAQLQSGIQQPPEQQPASQPAPAPHAWSFERQPEAARQSSSPSPYGRFDN